MSAAEGQAPKNLHGGRCGREASCFKQGGAEVFPA